MITRGNQDNRDISCNSDIRIEGSLKGNLVAKGKLVIGRKPKLKAMKFQPKIVILKAFSMENYN